MKTIETKFGMVMLDDDIYNKIQKEGFSLVFFRNTVYISKKGRRKTLLGVITGGTLKGTTFEDGNKLNYTRENLIELGKISSVKKHIDYVEIPINIGKVKLDIDDYERLVRLDYKSIVVWSGNLVIVFKNRSKQLRLTSFVSGEIGGRGLHIRFKDRDNLNYRKSNLLYDFGEFSTSNGSKYKGVRKVGKQKLYRVEVPNKGKEIHVGSYKDEIVAAVAYNKAMDTLLGEGKHTENKVPLNDAIYREIYNNIVINLIQRSTRQGVNRKAKGTTSKYTGVYFIQYKSGATRWRAKTEYQGVRINCGVFGTELEAAQAYNETVLYLYGEEAKLNPVPKPMHPIINLDKIKQKLEKKGIKIERV